MRILRDYSSSLQALQALAKSGIGLVEVHELPYRTELECQKWRFFHNRVAFGGPRIDNFIAFNSERWGPFLDKPEFTPRHDRGILGERFRSCTEGGVVVRVKLRIRLEISLFWLAAYKV